MEQTDDDDDCPTQSTKATHGGEVDRQMKAFPDRRTDRGLIVRKPGDLPFGNIFSSRTQSTAPNNEQGVDQVQAYARFCVGQGMRYDDSGAASICAVACGGVNVCTRMWMLISLSAGDLKRSIIGRYFAEKADLQLERDNTGGNLSLMEWDGFSGSV